MNQNNSILSRLSLWFFAMLTVAPFLLVLDASFKSQSELLQGFFSIPTHMNFKNYISAWQEGHFKIYFINSLVIVFPVVIMSLFLGSLSGFAFAFLELPGKTFIALLLAIGMVLPSESFVIPLYHEMHWLGLINTHLVLILPQVALSIPFSTLMMTTAFKQVPKEMIEAAVMDNTPRLTILWKILLPATRPSLLTLALLLFIWTWNEFLLPLILVNVEELRTLPIGMMFFQNRNTINIPVLMAGAMIVIIPLIIIFLLFQRKFISGVTEGAVK